jgi:hypothetical protein
MEQIYFNQDTQTIHNSWKPKIGVVALDVLNKNKIKGNEKDTILNEAVDIIKSCGNPKNGLNGETGLVVGYVQSGKTLSFTTVAGLAAENGFDCIIIIAGTTTALLDQTHDRVFNDLDNPSAEVEFVPYKTPSEFDVDDIVQEAGVDVFNNKNVLLFTVMKNPSQLEGLVKIFSNPKVKSLKLNTLIIDDEADQASLNTKASDVLTDEVSTTYRLLSELREELNSHTYLQYTATPQAPLFISLMDILSPSFAKVITPGIAYTGGKTFFKRNQDSNYPYLRNIDEIEIHTKKQPLKKVPESLEESIRFYLLTVVIGVLEGETRRNNNRTMMIHPSVLTEIHDKYFRWTKSILRRFREELSLEVNDIDRKNLISKFYCIYEALPKYIKEKHSFLTIENTLLGALKTVKIQLANATSKKDIDWKRNYAMIVVGGQILDRGFTIEGLNVTYMPRSIGVGNADTIQQRCRFFGYKKSYLDLCRIYLPRLSKRAYIDYVLHEEDMRNKLIDFSGTNKPLYKFKRQFILSPVLNITRSNVIADDISRLGLSGWKTFDKIDRNQTNLDSVISDFEKSLNFGECEYSGDNEKQTHEAVCLNSEKLIDKLLSNLSYMEPNMSLNISYLITMLQVLEKEHVSEVYVVNMVKGAARERSIKDGKISNIMQGSNTPTNYLGDRKVKSEGVFTIQIHSIRNKETKEMFKTIAVHIPRNITQSIITLK